MRGGGLLVQLRPDQTRGNTATSSAPELDCLLEG